MDNTLIVRLRDHAASQPRALPFPPASEKDLQESERRLGFSIPELLRSVYLSVGNGGFGPGRGGTIIGVRRGYKSDFGRLVETYEQLKRDEALMGGKWKAGLLPFCEWGCNMFSCVSCHEPHAPIYLFEEGSVSSQNLMLRAFFEEWMQGAGLLTYEGMVTESVEIINPFTRKKTRVTRRKKGG